MNKLKCITATMLLTSSSVIACPEGYYSDDFGICWPDSGYIERKGRQAAEEAARNMNPATQAGRIIALGQAIISGDRDRMVKALGDTVINSPGCIGCSVLTTTVINNLSKDQINKIVGEGYLTFIITGNPVLVFIDVGTNILKESQVTPPAQNPFSQPPSEIKRQYSGNADCILKEINSNRIMAGWKSAPVLTGKDGDAYTYPLIALNEGDTLILHAPICSQLNNNVQTSVGEIIMKYKYSNTFPGKQADDFKVVFSGESGG